MQNPKLLKKKIKLDPPPPPVSRRQKFRNFIVFQVIGA